MMPPCPRCALQAASSRATAPRPIRSSARRAARSARRSQPRGQSWRACVARWRACGSGQCARCVSPIAAIPSAIQDSRPSRSAQKASAFASGRSRSSAIFSSARAAAPSRASRPATASNRPPATRRRLDLPSAVRAGHDRCLPGRQRERHALEQQPATAQACDVFKAQRSHPAASSSACMSASDRPK